MIQLPLIQALRSETSSQHQNLEKKLAVLKAEWTVSAYRGFLQRYFRFYVSFEANIKGLSFAREPFFASRLYKTKWLSQDLSNLEVSLSAIKPFPSSHAINPQTLGQVMGCLYVVEGSMLGGQMLHRFFEKQLGWQTNAYRFFEGYGENTKLMWEEFKLQLEKMALDQNEEGFRIEVVRAAGDCFSAIEICLTEHELAS